MSANTSNATVAVLHITVSSPFHIHHTGVAQPTTLSGNYIATPQHGSHPLAYDLVRADQNWIAQGPKFVAVFIEVDANGVAVIS